MLSQQGGAERKQPILFPQSEHPNTRPSCLSSPVAAAAFLITLFLCPAGPVYLMLTNASYLLSHSDLAEEVAEKGVEKAAPASLASTLCSRIAGAEEL